MGCGRGGQVANGRDLPTPPTAPATMRWVTFRLSKGYFFNCQSSDETAQVGHFSIVKWVLFRLTKTVTQYFAALEFEGLWGATYSAFVINLVMSVLFIGMLVRRDSVEGQSMVVAVFKWLGTMAPTILFYRVMGSDLVLVLGCVIFVFDVIYIGLLYQKFRSLGLNPFTRKPAH